MIDLVQVKGGKKLINDLEELKRVVASGGGEGNSQELNINLTEATTEQVQQIVQQAFSNFN